ncbi:MAG: hydantoinase/oxoprolinase family protein [Pseudomonadota bacterium]
MRIGVDIGGTFMDFCAFDPRTNQLNTLKVLTTPDDPGQELAKGIALLEARDGLDPHSVDAFVHGTTVGINTIIQRKGARLALITTAGFEDVIELARLRMPDVYSLFCARPDQLIPRDRVFGVTERMTAAGTVETPLDGAGLAAVIEAIKGSDVDGVIVSFLHSYRNRAHEAEACAALKRLAPALFVFSSADVWPVIREYERTTTAILNGYVHPRIAGYLDSLQATLKGAGVPAAPMLTRSNGGIMNVEAGKTNCVSMLLSGTASGVIGAAFVGRRAGADNLLTLDVGGTSADLALVIDGAPQYGTGETIGDFPLHIPSVSVTSIGAGGGSIAWVDSAGVLKVGPESAGSTPGPACYGRGGIEATITDAMAVCGFVGQAPLAYDQLTIDTARAHQAIAPLAAKLGTDVARTAEAIIEVAVSEMFVEVNKLVARQGIDLRDFHLMPFGGGGPMLGCFLARELGMAHMLVPHSPGIVSALGGLVADLKADFIGTVFKTLSDEALGSLSTVLDRLHEDGLSWLREEQGYEGPATAEVSAEMRYAGQSHEIDVPLEAEWITAGNVEAVSEAFHREHHKRFEFNDRDVPIQIINLRLVMRGSTVLPDLDAAPRAEGTPQAEREIAVWLDGAERTVPLYDRADLLHGHSFNGPAVVHQPDTTLCILPGYRATVDAGLNIRLTATKGGAA